MKNKIIKMLDKVESEELLERIYEFVKYIYISIPFASLKAQNVMKTLA